jgi:hypothetical protein
VQDEPPVVVLPGHPAKAGYILEWRQRSDRDWEALVEYVLDAPGFRGGLQPPVRQWVHESHVEKVRGEDYSRVPRTRA